MFYRNINMLGKLNAELVMQSHRAGTVACQNQWEFALKCSNEGTLDSKEYDFLERPDIEVVGAERTSMFKDLAEVVELEQFSGKGPRKIKSNCQTISGLTRNLSKGIIQLPLEY